MCLRRLTGNVAMCVLPIKVITKTQSDVTQHSQYYHLLTAPDHPKTSESLLLAVPVPALCLPNKGNHRDTRLVHKGDLQYIHTLFVKQHIFLGLRLSFFAGVGNFSYILQDWEWCVAQLSGWHSLCLMHYTAQFWQGRISFFISYLLLFHLLSFYL